MVSPTCETYAPATGRGGFGLYVAARADGRTRNDGIQVGGCRR